MPEWPEMERYREILNRRITARTITDVTINRPKSINVPEATFHEQLLGNCVTTVTRRAKHLLFRLGTGQYLLLHLMLGGWIYLGTDEDSPDRTKQVIIAFDEVKLYFIGLRLGYLHLLSLQQMQEKLADLGPEPFDPVFQIAEFVERLRRKKGTLKSILVDQKFISGIGNCYSDEICFEAGLRTDRRSTELSDDEVRALYAAIRPVLSRAAHFGGYMDDPMFAGDIRTGGYNDHLLVYDRAGLPCRRCGTPVEELEVSSRKSFLCPHCQA